MPAFSVKNLPESTDLFAQFDPRHLLLNPLIGPVRIAQDKKIKVLEFLGFLHRSEDDPQPFKNSAHILVKNRHHDCRGRQERIVTRRQRFRYATIVAAAIQHVKAHKRRAKPRGNVRKQHDKQSQQKNLQPADPFPPQQVRHKPSRQTR